MSDSKTLKRYYDKLRQNFGPQHWWPGDGPFEVMVGAVLTQNTNWGNVEKAINNLKEAGELSPTAIYKMRQDKLARLIRPSGYFNIKAKRLKGLIKWFVDRFDGDIQKMFSQDLQGLREELLSVKGVGPETADSILLYAGNLPSFVVDTYTYRVLVRHQLIFEESTYDDIKSFFEDNLPEDIAMYNEYHALLVQVGKRYCKPREPSCEDCPLNEFL
ncbi:MAG: endonuclease III domain-containing protein [Candidatus Brocadiales bacterium]|nr:endonuclease III domain-containing protein [Candidatus Bathyanammoxibius amoris]